jgi:serine protease
VDGAEKISSYSNFGPWIDLAAPGGDGRRDANLDGRPDLVISSSASLIDGRFQPVYSGLQGTSMASPHVAGVFALMRSVNSELDVDSLQALLINGDLTSNGGSGRNNTVGYGVIDASKAVSVALSNPAITVLSASPSVVTLSTETNPVQQVLLQESGSDSISVVADLNAIDTPEWLEVVPSENPLALTLTLVEDNLEPGVPVRTTLSLDYTSDSSRTLDIPVVAEVVNDELARDAGQHFILLVNAEPEGNEFETEAQVRAFVNPDSGQYEFSFELDDGKEPRRFNEVRPGRYFLVAGTDLDNDGVICQAGEACAEFPVSGLREEIEVDENTNLANITMTTGYSRPGISASTPDLMPRPDFKGYRLLTDLSAAGSGLKTLEKKQ